MADFPRSSLPLIVTSFSIQYSAMAELRPHVLCSTGSRAWTADMSTFMPFTIPFDYPVNRMFWCNGTTITTSNANVGIYTRNGKQIYASGSTALSGASTLQFVTPGTSFWLPAGSYFFAFACDQATNRVSGATPTVQQQQSAGVLQQASNTALADPATFATPTVAVYPMVGMTRTQANFPI